MKRYLALVALLAFLVVPFLGGCKSEPPKPTPPKPAPTTTTSPDAGTATPAPAPK
jgi:PBP1b-binding outer membrane lipoprotein LpoB